MSLKRSFQFCTAVGRMVPTVAIDDGRKTLEGFADHGSAPPSSVGNGSDGEGGLTGAGDAPSIKLLRF